MKLYAEEPDSTTVRGAVKEADIIACHLIAYTETRAALARKRRLGEMDDNALAELKRAFERDWVSIHRLPVNELTVRRAGDLAEQYGLRGYDSLHLAAAESLQSALYLPVTFACFDGGLNKVAREIGMQILVAA